MEQQPPTPLPPTLTTSILPFLKFRGVPTTQQQKTKQLNVKVGKGIEKYFSTDNIKTAKRYMKRCSTTLIISGVQITPLSVQASLRPSEEEETRCQRSLCVHACERVSVCVHMTVCQDWERGGQRGGGGQQLLRETVLCVG